MTQKVKVVLKCCGVLLLVAHLYVRVMSPVKVRNERHRGDRKTTE